MPDPTTTTTTLPPWAAITYSEKMGSRRGRAAVDQSTELDYIFTLRGSDDITQLVAKWDSVAPMSVVDPAIPTQDLWRNNLDWTQLGPGCWEFTSTYIDGRKHDELKQPETGDYKISGSTTGGTAKILVSKATIAKYAPSGETALDFKQSIGVTREGEVQGVEIVVPAMKFTIDYTQPKAVITVNYSKLLEDLTGTVNNSTFFGRPAGEVLFLGADFSQGIKSDPTCSYQFLRLPNIAGATIGDLTGIAKLGHEYLWIYFEEQPDPAAKNRPAKRPKYAYVERVYDLTDFSSLGIGTS
jgi:hypothetical protein